jgi:hypothetical protein
MKRVWGHVLAAVTLLGGGGLTVSACVHDNSTLFIRNVLAPQLVTNGQQCIFTADPTQPFITSGTLDVDFRASYEAEFLVGNQMVPQGNASTPTTETSRVTLQGGIIRITDSAGNQIANYTRYSSATVDPLQGTDPGFIPINLTIVDPATVAMVSGMVSQGTFPGGRPTVRLVTYTRVYGYTLGGDYVESNEFEFPVDVCAGCLIQFAPQDVSPNLPAPNCANAQTNGTSSLPVPCELGQDFTIDCSQCVGYGIADCNPNVPVGYVADAGAG